MKTLCCWTGTFLLTAASLAAADEAEKYTLRYRFQPGETVRWNVEHRSNVRTTVSGTTKTLETVSLSLKAWQVTDVQPDGTATFEHRVERVNMRQNLSGCAETRYNSETDAKPAAGFEDAAKSVGIVLTTVTLDAKGKVLHRKDSKPRPTGGSTEKGGALPGDGWMTLPLPDEAVPVGYTWSLPSDIEVPLEDGTVKKIKAIQQFTLVEVKTGVATIHVSTDILSPITDPAIEAQVVQHETAGKVRFDIDAGRVIGQQMDVNRHVIGFRGEASSIHYLNRFSEQLVSEPVKTAEKTIAATVEK